MWQRDCCHKGKQTQVPGLSEFQKQLVDFPAEKESVGLGLQLWLRFNSASIFPFLDLLILLEFFISLFWTSSASFVGTHPKQPLFKGKSRDGGSSHAALALCHAYLRPPARSLGKMLSQGAVLLVTMTYLLKTQLFNFLGNMGYMSVKDELPQGLEF